MKGYSRQTLQYATLAVFLFINIFIWSAVARADRAGVLTVAFLDVGQGDAIYIEAPNGNQMLVDGGPPSGAVLRALGSVMPFWDRSLDVVLATHPDQDHVGGLPSVLARMRIDNVITTENTSDTGAYAAFEKMIYEKHPTRILARAGKKIILDEGVVFEIIFPNMNTDGWETNTASIVARLSYGDQSFIFTGDSPISVEKYLVGKNGGALHSTVLKLGHHGSKTSSSQIFLSAVNPDYAIISAGLNNKYGHPHKEVIDLLTELKIPSISTAEQGTVILKTDGTNMQIN
ncbi:MAG: ComEC/Rec2 family competence protein [Minisyncoccia bacterium]